MYQIQKGEEEDMEQAAQALNNTLGNSTTAVWKSKTRLKRSENDNRKAKLIYILLVYQYKMVDTLIKYILTLLY